MRQDEQLTRGAHRGGVEERLASSGLSSSGCLFVSFVYESGFADERARELIAAAVRHWRSRLLAKLEAAAAAHPPAIAVDLPSLADHVFTTFEGAFILARALDDPGHVRAQLAQLRHYLALLFQGAPAAPNRRRGRRHAS